MATGTRPGGVTLVAVFIWISGAINILGGVLALIFQNNPDVELSLGGRPGTITYGIIAILLGIVVIAVSGGILNGSRGARIIVTIVQIVAILGSIFAIFAYPATLWQSILNIVIALIPIFLLYSPKANAFFGDSAD
jgi:hypothetical protein